MAYPQPDADQYVINGYDFFRLNTLLATGGDIYESAQSGLGFAVGPESDIANVNVGYFDQQILTRINKFGIGPARSFVGRADANNLGQYLPAQRPARVLIWPDDMWNPAFRIHDAHASTNSIVEVPRLDVIQFFTNQPSSIVPRRHDKTWLYQTLFTGGGDQVNYVTIPYYGRRYAKIIFNSHFGESHTYNITVTGLDFQQQALSGGTSDTALFTGVQPDFLKYKNVNGTIQFIVDGGRDIFDPASPASVTNSNMGGMFDMLTIGVRNNDATNASPQEYMLKIITSDYPGGSTS
jgi:hypothetical protein